MINQFRDFFDKDKLYKEELLMKLTKLDLEKLYDHENVFNGLLKQKHEKSYCIAQNIFFNENIQIEINDSNRRINQIIELIPLKTIKCGSVTKYMNVNHTPEWKQKLDYEKLLKERDMKNESRPT